jgi:hypothetical protein
LDLGHDAGKRGRKSHFSCFLIEIHDFEHNPQPLPRGITLRSSKLQFRASITASAGRIF